MISSALSDLFFNHNHPTLNIVFQKGDVSIKELEEAIYYDAYDWWNLYHSVLKDDITPQELAEDYLKRI